jgi:hypothetical protein
LHPTQQEEDDLAIEEIKEVTGTGAAGSAGPVPAAFRELKRLATHKENAEAEHGGLGSWAVTRSLSQRARADRISELPADRKRNTRRQHQHEELLMEMESVREREGGGSRLGAAAAAAVAAVASNEPFSHQQGNSVRVRKPAPGQVAAWLE